MYHPPKLILAWKIVSAWVRKLLRHDANLPIELTVNGNRLAQHVRISTESHSPQQIADHHHKRISRPIVFRLDRAPQLRVCLKRLEEIAEDFRASDLFCGHQRRVTFESADGFERLARYLPCRHVGIVGPELGPYGRSADYRRPHIH